MCLACSWIADAAAAFAHALRDAGTPDSLHEVRQPVSLPFGQAAMRRQHRHTDSLVLTRIAGVGSNVQNDGHLLRHSLHCTLTVLLLVRRRPPLDAACVCECRTKVGSASAVSPLPPPHTTATATLNLLLRPIITRIHIAASRHRGIPGMGRADLAGAYSPTTP